MCLTHLPQAARSHESDGPGYPKAGVVSLRETELHNILIVRVGCSRSRVWLGKREVASLRRAPVSFRAGQVSRNCLCLPAAWPPAFFEAAQLGMTSTDLNVSRSSLRPRPIPQARLHFAPM